MKKLLFLLLATALFISCEKDDTATSLKGTTWTTTISDVHKENGKDYPYQRVVEVKFTTEKDGVIEAKAVSLPDNMSLDALVANFTYTYSNSAGTIALVPNGESTTFTVSGNTMKVITLIPGYKELVLTKK